MVEMIEDLGEEDYQYEDEFEEVSFDIISMHFGSICANNVSAGTQFIFK